MFIGIVYYLSRNTIDDTNAIEQLQYTNATTTGGARGQAADIELQAKEILFVRSQINDYIARFTDQPVEKIEEVKRNKSSLF